MANPPHQFIGSKGSMTNLDIRITYADFFRGFLGRDPGTKKIRDAINRFELFKDGVELSTNTLTYAPRSIAYQGGIFQLPELVFIGYTSAQEVLIDQFYEALKDRLTTDPQFRASRAMQSLQQLGSEKYFSLGSPVSLAADQIGGAAAPESENRFPDLFDGQIETLVDGNNININNSTGKAEFLLRLFHELLHRDSTHGQDVYDTGGTLLENARRLKAGLTPAQIAGFDLQYGGTQETLLTLGAALGINARDVTGPTLGKIDGGQVALNEKLLERKVRKEAATQYQNGTEFDEDTLKILVALDILKLKAPEIDPNTGKRIPRDGKKTSDYEITQKVKNSFTEAEKKEVGLIKYNITESLFDSLAEAVDSALSFARDVFEKHSGDIGRIFGSTLGQQFAKNEGQAVRILASTSLGVIGMNLGELLEARLRGANIDPSNSVAFDNIGEDFKNAGIGAISSLLTAELLQALQIEGTLGELGQSVFSSQLGIIIGNLAQGARTVADVFDGLGNISSIGSIVGGYFGTKLAASLVQFDTVGGQIGSSVGTAIGTTVGIFAAKDAVLLGARL